MVATRADRYVGLFLAAFLPNGRLFSLQASQISSAGWIRHHDGLCRSEKTLRLITLAHGLSMLATRDDNIQLKVKGSQAHCMALQEMQRAVQDPQRAVGDGLLAAVRLFRFYEVSSASFCLPGEWVKLLIFPDPIWGRAERTRSGESSPPNRGLLCPHGR